MPLTEADVPISFRRKLVETCLSHKGSMDLNARMNYNYLLIGAWEIHDFFRSPGGPRSNWVIHNTQGQEIASASHFTSRLPKDLCYLSFFPRSQWPGQPTWLLGACGMVRGPPSARGLHSDQQVPGQAVYSPAGEDALGEQVTLKHSDCQCMAWDMQLSNMDVVSWSPAQLCGAELSPCLLGSFIFPAEDPQSGQKVFVKTWLSKNSAVVFASVCLQWQHRNEELLLLWKSSFLTRELVLQLALFKYSKAQALKSS